MVETVAGGYRAMRKPPASIDRYVFEGVDGDEDAGTVTYWVRRRVEGDV